MSFVGTRPEAVKYVKKYKPEYMATLLLPAGITSEASIRYKDEAELCKFLLFSFGDNYIGHLLVRYFLHIHFSNVIICDIYNVNFN